jgi:hypothetical protein
LVLEFTQLDLEVSEGCQNDYVEIENIGRYCKPDQTGNGVIRIHQLGFDWTTNTNVKNSYFIGQLQQPKYHKHD